MLKKGVIIKLLIMLTVFVNFCGTTMIFAAEADGITVNITKDKEEYDKDEVVEITIKVTNNNNFIVDEIVIENILPEGITLVKEQKKSIEDIKLNPKETYEFKTKVVRDDSPKTGDLTSNIENKNISNTFKIIVSLIIVIAVIVYIYKNRKGATKITSILLCMTMLLSVLQGVTVKAEENKNTTLEENIEYKIGDRTYKHGVRVSYRLMNLGLTIDTSVFSYKKEIKAYLAKDKVSMLKGSLEKVQEVKSMIYEIVDSNKKVVKSGTINVANEWNINDFGLVPGENILKIIATTRDNKQESKEIKIINFNIDNIDSVGLDKNDSDNDGLANYIEDHFGTNRNKKDTDGDGVSDLDEIKITSTNPLMKDTDSNGINDGDEDLDKDGLNNIEEISQKTINYLADTDEDGLTDGDEVKKYNTNPLVADTDGDEINDGDEIKLGLNPLEKDTDGDGILDNEEKFEQKKEVPIECEEKKEIKNVSVEIECAGNIENTVTIENTYGKDTLSTGVVGLIGVPVNIESETEFTSATITFTYDDTLLGDTKEEDLAIIWYDETNNMYQILDEDSVIDTENNTVSYKTTHFSTYLVVDRQIWYDTWRQNIDYRGDGAEGKEQYYDIAFVVDNSGSMRGGRIEKAKLAMNTFIDALYDKDNATLIKFNSYATVLKPYGSTKEDLRSGVNSMYASGGTNTNEGLKLGIEELVNGSKNSTNQKMIIMICDGDVYYVQQTIDRAIANNIKIFPVNVVNSSVNTLKSMAEQTGGEYYHATTIEEIEDAVSKIQGDTVNSIDTTDTDGDGLYDVFEVNGVRVSNGEVWYSDPFIADTDGDGISDYAELGGTPELLDFYFKIGKYSCVINRSTSNPKLMDTDGDTYNDGEDLKPQVVAVNSDMFRKVSSIDYEPPFIRQEGYMKETIDKSNRDYMAGVLEYSSDELYDIYVAAAWIAVGGGLVADNAGDILCHYLDNVGTEYEIYVWELLSESIVASSWYNKNLKAYKSHIESVLKDGDSLYIASRKAQVSRNNNIAGVLDLNWMGTIGGASGAFVSEASKSGALYSLDYRYIVFDFYDWQQGSHAKFPFSPVEDGELFQLHHAGWAKQFLVYGEMRSSLNWLKLIESVS